MKKEKEWEVWQTDMLMFLKSLDDLIDFLNKTNRKYSDVPVTSIKYKDYIKLKETVGVKIDSFIEFTTSATEAMTELFEEERTK